MASFLACQVTPEQVAAARRGERKAQEALYREYSPAVFTLAMRIVSHREAAEEVLQDTFIEVLSKLDGFRGQAPLGAWIRRIAVNKALMFLRSGWRRYARPLEAVAEPGAAGDSGDEHGLGDALAQLSPTARAVVWLHDVEGYTHKEIGEMMKKSQSFSKSQLSRAHRRLRELIDEDTGDISCMRALNNC
ncbi:MAG: sigma-70 family RNA polymerase sigma factor [Gammaproteobacteria bacterium]|nr:sigma-70 family RNA polymerase sigma factor [Gammaproteobacteria bacterium]NNM20557.1 sigma-70 family RNA polymerase sigma factor [Gammaproteobacteria bacterium]